MKILTKRLTAAITVFILAGSLLVPTAFAAPTTGDLVNTEAFIEIGEGDGATDVQLKFGDSGSLNHWLLYSITNSQFELSAPMLVDGNISQNGDTFILDADNNDTDTTLQFGGAAQTIVYDETANEFVMSDDLNVQGDVMQDGTNFELDADNTGAGANVTVTANQGTDNDGVLRYNATTNEWEISNDGGTYYAVSTSNDLDNAQGTNFDSWTIDLDDNSGGNVTLQFGNAANYILWNGTNFELSATLDFNGFIAQEMALDQGSGALSFPATPSDGQVFYRTDNNTMYIYDAGTAAWIAQASSGGNGNIFLAPEYPDTTYYGGPAVGNDKHVGTLKAQYDSANDENAYRWETTRATSQTYNLVVKIQLPDNFSAWKATPIEFTYRTDTTNAADNDIDFTMTDTNGVAVNLVNNTGLVSTLAGDWVDGTITFGLPAGTWNPGDWFTVNLEVAATSTGGTEAGRLLFNYDTI